MSELLLIMTMMASMLMLVSKDMMKILIKMIKMTHIMLLYSQFFIQYTLPPPCWAERYLIVVVENNVDAKEQYDEDAAREIQNLRAKVLG